MEPSARDLLAGLKRRWAFGITFGTKLRLARGDAGVAGVANPRTSAESPDGVQPNMSAATGASTDPLAPGSRPVVASGTEREPSSGSPRAAHPQESVGGAMAAASRDLADPLAPGSRPFVASGTEREPSSGSPRAAHPQESVGGAMAAASRDLADPLAPGSRPFVASGTEREPSSGSPRAAHPQESVGGAMAAASRDLADPLAPGSRPFVASGTEREPSSGLPRAAHPQESVGGGMAAASRDLTDPVGRGEQPISSSGTKREPSQGAIGATNVPTPATGTEPNLPSAGAGGLAGRPSSARARGIMFGANRELSPGTANPQRSPGGARPKLPPGARSPADRQTSAGGVPAAQSCSSASPPRLDRNASADGGKREGSAPAAGRGGSAPSAGGRGLAERLKRSWGILSAIALATVWAAEFGWLAVQRHLAGGSHAEDLGFTDQVLANFLRGQFFRMSLYQGATWNTELDVSRLARPDSLLAFHFEPMLLLLVPLYAVGGGATLLLALQAVVVAAGAVPAYRLGTYTSAASAGGLAVALAYLLSPLGQWAILADFHTSTLAAPLLLLAVERLAVQQSVVQALAVAALAASTREDVGLVIAALGLVLLVRGRLCNYAHTLRTHSSLCASPSSLPPPAAARLPADELSVITDRHAERHAPTEKRHAGVMATSQNRTWPGMAFLTLGLGSTLLAALVIRAYSGGVVPFDVRYGATLGAGRDATLAALARPAVFGYLGTLALSGGWLGIFSPLALLPALPTVALNILSTSPWMAAGKAHYSSLVLPFITVGAAWGLRRLRGQLRRLYLASAALVLTGLIGYLLEGAGPLGGNYAPGGVTAHAMLAETLARGLPEGAAVSASSAVVPRVSRRPRVYVFPAVLDADYVLLDLQASPAPTSAGDVFMRVGALLSEGGWQVETAEDGLLLLQRAAGAPPTDIRKLSHALGLAAAGEGLAGQGRASQALAVQPQSGQGQVGQAGQAAQAQPGQPQSREGQVGQAIPVPAQLQQPQPGLAQAGQVAQAAQAQSGKPQPGLPKPGQGQAEQARVEQGQAGQAAQVQAAEPPLGTFLDDRVSLLSATLLPGPDAAIDVDGPRGLLRVIWRAEQALPSGTRLEFWLDLNTGQRRHVWDIAPLWWNPPDSWTPGQAVTIDVPDVPLRQFKSWQAVWTAPPLP